MSKQCAFMNGCTKANLVTCGCTKATYCEDFVDMFSSDSSSGKVRLETIRVPLNSETQFQVAAVCEICNEAFVISNIEKHSVMCPECRKRLKRILYPERPTGVN